MKCTRRLVLTTPCLALAVAIAVTTAGCGGTSDDLRLPALVSGTALPGAAVVPSTAWLQLSFAADIPDGAAVSPDVFKLDCGPETPAIDVDLMDPRSVVINPRAELPPSAGCALSWPGPEGNDVSLGFSVSPASSPAVVVYDRNDPNALAPFPDDYFRVDDAQSNAGFRLEIPVPDHNTDAQTVIGSFVTMIDSDGFSPLSTVVIPLPSAPQAGSIPLTSADSMDPFATIALFDVTPDSDTLGQRVPFFASLRSETNPDGTPAHHLLLFPARPLRSTGTYVAVVLRRALTDSEQPLTPSDYSRKVLGVTKTATSQEMRGEQLLAPVLAALEQHASPPIRPDDIALALRFTVRDTSWFGRDRLAIRSHTQTLPPPTFVIESVDASANESIAAVVTGTWKAPIWNDGHYLVRDSQGLPTTSGTRDVRFFLTIPKSAATTPVPVTMFQHGTPARLSREIAWAGASLVGGGQQEFAAIGFTDLLNRDTEGLMLSPELYRDILDNKAFPDVVYNTTFAEQLSFIRLIGTLGELDVVPLGAPDGKPDLDISLPLTYLGVSHGSINGVGLLPYAPEIRAAALVAGGGNYAGVLAHQSEAVKDKTYANYPALTRSEIYVTFPLMQIPFDTQDPANHGRFMYAEPHNLADSARASILMSEGAGDSFVPLWSTQTGAAALGIPMLEPAPLAAPFLDSATNALTANINTTTTAALAQYIPVGIAGLPPTPGCLATGQSEGHFCPQSAAEAFAQRRAFLASAITETAPTIEPHDTLQAAPAPLQVPHVTIVNKAAATPSDPR